MRCVIAPVAADPDAPSWATLDGVRNMQERFPGAGLRRVTVLRAPDLDREADPDGDTRVWLALESLQVTGSFKVRGALVALDALRGHGRAVAASAGNHGAAVAFASRVLGIRASVCVPRSVPRAKRARIERYGAELVVAQSDHYDDAEALAKELSVTQEAPFVSPYDDLGVILGNGASLGFEIVSALGGVPERLIAPFGGGGLATGLAWALAADTDGAPDRAVWGAQSEASCAMALSLEGGAAVERLVSDAPTLAEGLEGGISRDAFARARAAVAGVVVVTEAQIARAMQYAYRELGLVIEGSAGAALAPVLAGLPEPVRGGA
jgi:threonine dehydratase